MSLEAQHDLQLTVAAKVFQCLYNVDWHTVSVAYATGSEGERLWFRPRTQAGELVHTAPPNDLGADFAALRNLMADAEEGPWYAAQLTLARTGVMDYAFSHDGDTEWGADGPDLLGEQGPRG